MKWTATEADFPVERQIIRMTICVPADRCTRNEPMIIPLEDFNSDNIDAIKKILTYRIREITRRCRSCSASNCIRMADICNLQNLSYHWPF